MPQPREKADVIIHARLVNWARWATGGLPDGDDPSPHGPLDTIDAEKVEAALNVMKARRNRWYRLCRRMYVNRWTDYSLCAEFRCGETALKGYVRSMYAWLDGRLPPLERNSPLHGS